MTPSQLEQAARERYNAVGETFWSQSEMLALMYAASQELATETKCIEQIYTTTTVSGTKEYAYPTSAIGIKYVTYNGIPIDPIDLDEGNSITLNTVTSNTTGSPLGYSTWNYTISLWPTPNDAQALKLWTYNEAQIITVTSTLEVPSVFHTRLINYMLSEMYAKDKDFNSAAYYKKIWEADKTYVKQWIAKRKRGHRFAAVKDEERLPMSYSG
jgi:hypothetical protein